MSRIGRQTPTNSYIIPYKNTLGNEAVELYNNTTRTAMEWQEILMPEKSKEFISFYILV